MKVIIRKWFTPSYYYRDLHQKLQRFNQEFNSVVEYYKEMEVAMIRASVEEDREAAIARSFIGLSSNIANNNVELHHYVELENMVQMGIKVERQLRKRSSWILPPKSSPTTSKMNPTTPWK